MDHHVVLCELASSYLGVTCITRLLLELVLENQDEQSNAHDENSWTLLSLLGDD